ncbi:hypothetical protein FJC08_17700 [Escherichia coli]|nr:hypothetical protein [Escherichia coli]EFB1881116.1 hypothetical protein [Escherichia coli]EFJ2534866.1 hypothetical protein [Escherichia coli]HAJ7413158.1 hypothetical protein [Escherichia coli]
MLRVAQPVEVVRRVLAVQMRTLAVVAVVVAELEPMVACQEVTLTGMVLAAAVAAASTEITPV